MEKNELLQKVGVLIKERRKFLKLSQETLGAEAGLDRSYIGGIERGERNLSTMILFKISKALRSKPASFLEDVELSDVMKVLE